MSQEPGNDDVVFVGAKGRSDRPRRIAIGSAVGIVAMLGGALVAFAATNATASPSTPTAGSTAKPSTSTAPMKQKCASPTKTGQAAMPCPAFGGPFHRFGEGPGIAFGLGFPGLAFGAVHGQVVIAKSGGGYETIDIQRGKVTAVSTTSVSVRSADGFTATYAVGSSTNVNAQRDGISSVKVGNDVSVTATVSGSKATAVSITDLTLLQKDRGQFGGFGSPPVS